MKSGKGVFANACIREGVNHQTDGERQRAHLKAIAQSSIHEGYREADQKERQECADAPVSHPGTLTE